jgi:hypothetical protein
MKLYILALFLGISSALALAARVPDGAIIRNSGSTNTAGYVIKLWSTGKAQLQVEPHFGQTRPARWFTVRPAVASAFFTDVLAARARPGTPEHCMKSASFGTTTTVLWHGWQSPDLQCPPFSPAVQALDHDVRVVQAAAHIDVNMRRIPLPGGLRRMIPTPTPEVQPT